MSEQRYVVLALGLAVLTVGFGQQVSAQHGIGPDWGPERQVSSPGTDSSPGVGRMIGVDSSGGIHVVWQLVSANEVYYAQSTDDGANWSTPELLSTSTVPAGGANLAVGPDDTVHVAWLQQAPVGDPHVHYARSLPGGGFETPRDISGVQPLVPEAPAISVDLNNRVHVSWHIGDPSTAVGSPADAARVYYTRSLNGGDTFNTPWIISDLTGEHAAWPRFSVTGTSGEVVAITWRDNRVDPDWDLYVAVSTNAGTSFTNYAAAASSDREWDPEVIVDDNDVLHLTYTLPQPASFHLGDIAYKRSTDLGVNWSTEVILNDEVSFFSWLAFDATSGVLWLLWKDERDYVEVDLKGDLRLRYSWDSGISWSTPEFATDVGDLDVRFPALTAGPAGAAYVIWGDLRADPVGSTVFVRKREGPPPGPGIPTMSGWGLVAMTLVLLTAGTVLHAQMRLRRN